MFKKTDPTFILHRLRWGSGQSTPAIVAGQSWSRVTTPLRLMEILPKKGGIIVQRWDRRSCRAEANFSKVGGKKTKCHRKVYDEVVVCWGEALLCLFLESWICVLLGLLLHWHTAPLPFNSRIREPYQNLHVFREVFPKRNPYIQKKL